MKSIVLIGSGLLAAVLVSACSNFAFESNLNPNNFKEYAKPATVDDYTQEEIAKHRYHSLGMVSGLVCQEKENDFIARESEARTDARIKAADLGANAIVFGKCVRLEKTQACNVSVTCYGEAFIVKDKTPGTLNTAQSKQTGTAKKYALRLTPKAKHASKQVCKQAGMQASRYAKQSSHIFSSINVFSSNFDNQAVH